MKFKDFFYLDETIGDSIKPISPMADEFSKQFSAYKIGKGPSTVSKAMSAGKVKSPSRPAIFTSLNKPSTISSVLN